MNELTRPNPNDPTWQEIRPVLDDAMHELDANDKDAVLLRFFEGKSLREVGDALCLSENAARMRVDRALEKLRKVLARRGVHSTSSALAGALAVGVIAAPSTVTATVTSSALAAASISGAATSTLFGVTLTKAGLVGLGAVAIAAVSIPIWQQHRYGSLTQKNATLRNEVEHQVEQMTQLRDENQRLTEALRTADARAQNVAYAGFLTARGEAAAVPGLEPQGQNGTPGGRHEETWRDRFEAVYRLRGGEVLRRISPPFIPERAELCRREFRNLRSTPDYLVLRQTRRKLSARGVGFDGGKTTIEGVLRHVLGLKRYDFSGADQLLALPVAGDWVIRAGTSSQAQLAALEPILRAATGRNIHFEKQPFDVDVIVVRGTFAPAKKDQRYYVFAENKEWDWDTGGQGSFQKFLESLGDRLNVPFVSEVKLQNRSPICWSFHTDSDYSRAGNRRLELLNKVLANLGQQTSLTFGPQSRPGELWVVKEQ